MSVQETNARVAEVLPALTRLRENVGQVLVGQRRLFDRLFIGIVTHGHVLVEGLPGLAKTTAVKCLSDSLALSFSRIQFTPDLLPTDILGVEIYNPQEAAFRVKKGPIFAHVVLADEINRAPSKVQSALLEAMQERQVTIGAETFPLPRPFLVLATQNPLEQQGTYPLPEAQVDRFLLKATVDYPSEAEELQIMNRFMNQNPVQLEATMSSEELHRVMELQRDIFIEEKLQSYIVSLVRQTRPEAANQVHKLRGLIGLGASPRASIALAQCARVHAMLDGRGFVTPHDVKSIAPDVLRHRIMPSYEAEAEEIGSDELVGRVLDSVDVP